MAGGRDTFIDLRKTFVRLPCSKSRFSDNRRRHALEWAREGLIRTLLGPGKVTHWNLEG